MDKFPVLSTERLDLIEIEQKHFGDIYRLFSNEKVLQYYKLHPLKSEEKVQILFDWMTRRYDDDQGIRWGIVIKNSQNIIGTIGYNSYIRNHRANLGFDLQTDFWNSGYMSEAIKAVVSYGFHWLDLNRIEAEVMQGNIVSEILLQKMNFKKEGVLRQWLRWNEKYYDMSMFALLKTDFQENAKFYQ